MYNKIEMKKFFETEIIRKNEKVPTIKEMLEEIMQDRFNAYLA
jgi:hypothetical protein